MLCFLFQRRLRAQAVAAHLLSTAVPSCISLPSRHPASFPQGVALPNGLCVKYVLYVVLRCG